MAEINIGKTLSSDGTGNYIYTFNILKDKPTYTIIFPALSLYKYIVEKAPLYLGHKVRKDEILDYANHSFMFKSKRGNVKITVGRLIYYFYTVENSNHGKNGEIIPEEELFDIVDWMIIRETKVPLGDYNILDLYKKENKFHDYKAIEREIFDLVLNKRLRKPRNETLKEIKMYVDNAMSDIYLDSHYCCTEIENAKFVVKGHIIPAEYKEFNIFDDFTYNELLETLELSANVIKFALLLDYFIENNWGNSEDTLNIFTDVMQRSGIFEIKDYIKKRTSLRDF